LIKRRDDRRVSVVLVVARVQRERREVERAMSAAGHVEEFVVGLDRNLKVLGARC
jgi:hypothetical protein